MHRLIWDCKADSTCRPLECIDFRHDTWSSERASTSFIIIQASTIGLGEGVLEAQAIRLVKQEEFSYPNPYTKDPLTNYHMIITGSYFMGGGN